MHGKLAPAAILLLGLLAGCTAATAPDSEIEQADHLRIDAGDGVVFLTQDATDGAGMEALFTGPITVDGDGCFRTGTVNDYGVTVVWPAGYALEHGAAPEVVDGDGRVVGEVGGSFTLTGGEVSELTAAMGFTDADRALAHDRCPGGYWIVNAH